jgi:hypothetical protein
MDEGVILLWRGGRYFNHQKVKKVDLGFISLIIYCHSSLAFLVYLLAPFGQEIDRIGIDFQSKVFYFHVQD